METGSLAHMPDKSVKMGPVTSLVECTNSKYQSL